MYIFVVSVPWVAELGLTTLETVLSLKEYNQRLDECGHHDTHVILTLCVQKQEPKVQGQYRLYR